MIVVDLGCCPHDGDLSISPLVERFAPTVLYGFDPLLEYPCEFKVGGTRVVLEPKAAWTEDGQIELAIGAPSLLDATVLRAKNDRGEWSQRRRVDCFDFAVWLTDHPVETVVKMNIEGAEFPLLKHLVDTETDTRISLLVVQWHDHRLGDEFTAWRAELEGSLRCKVEEWVLPACV